MIYNIQYKYLKTLGGNHVSRKSNKTDTIGNPSAIANAMYDAQKKEITSSMVLSLSFIAAGLIVAVIGIFQYFSIKNNMTDSSESIDAMAWVVIAGVGLLVGIIGLVSIMRSVVSLGQIGSWAKEAESHASPFQAQKLHRKVAAMNQAQSMEKPANQGMAEGKQKRGFFKRGKENKNKQNSDELYYKYNPQEKKAAPPQKSAPVMEQKFDYGINEDKKLTFADEFLKKNKRDPFAQYRKDLGIKEEPVEETKQKPKFIISNPVNQNNTASVPVQVPVQKTDHDTDLLGKTLVPQKETSVPSLDKQDDEESGFDFAMSYLSQNEDKTEQPKTSSYDNASSPVRESTVETISQPEEPAVSVSNSPYGEHNESDDDYFFSAKTSTAVSSQQQTPIVQQHQPAHKAQPSGNGFTPDISAAMSKQSGKSKNLAPPTVMLDLDYKKERPSEEYDFSLFEEIAPGKTKKSSTNSNTSQKTSEKNNYDDMFFGSTNQSSQENQEFESDFLTDFAKQSESKTNYNSLNYTTQAETAKKSVKLPDIESKSAVDETGSRQSIAETSFSYPNGKPTFNNDFEQSKATQSTQIQNQEQTAPQQYSSSQQQFVLQKQKQTTTPPKTRATRAKKNKQNNKKSFSESFLSKNGKIENSNSEIVKNGTRSQRKFVDASEYDEWSCPQCGKVNQEYVGVCACGSRKPRPRKH